jgi:hypothetical protein
VYWENQPEDNINVMEDNLITSYAEQCYQQVISGEKTAMTVSKLVLCTYSDISKKVGSGTTLTFIPTISTDTGIVNKKDTITDGYNIYIVP